MVTNKFDYIRAESVDDAITLMVKHGMDAKLLAGGHSLIPAMKLRLAAAMQPRKPCLRDGLATLAVLCPWGPEPSLRPALLPWQLRQGLTGRSAYQTPDATLSGYPLARCSQKR